MYRNGHILLFEKSRESETEAMSPRLGCITFCMLCPSLELLLDLSVIVFGVMRYFCPFAECSGCLREAGLCVEQADYSVRYVNHPEHCYHLLPFEVLIFPLVRDIGKEFMAGDAEKLTRRSMRSASLSKNERPLKSSSGKRILGKRTSRTEDTPTKKSRVEKNLLFSRRASSSQRISKASAAQERNSAHPSKRDFPQEICSVMATKKGTRSGSSGPVGHEAGQRTRNVFHSDDDYESPVRNNLPSRSSAGLENLRGDGRLGTDDDHNTAPQDDNQHIKCARAESNLEEENDCVPPSLTASNAYLFGIFKRIEKDFVNHMKGFESRVSSKIADLREEQQQIKHELEEIRGTQSLGASTKSTSSARTSLSLWNEKLDQLTPHADYVFKSGALTRIACINVAVTIFTIGGGSGQLLHNCSTAIETIIFGKQPNQPRNVLHNGVGLRHCEFRQSFVLTLLVNLHNNRLGVFNSTRDDEAEVNGPGDSTATLGSPGSRTQPATCHHSTRNSHGVCDTCQVDKSPRSATLCRKIDQPRWLQKGLIRGDDVSEARAYLETVPESRGNQCLRIGPSGNKLTLRKTVVKSTPSKRDIALHGAKKIFSLVTGFLHDGRERCKAIFAEELGYLMVDWDSFKSDASQETLKIKWAYPENDFAIESLHAVSKTVRSSQASIEVDASNIDRMRKLVVERLDMVFVVEHEVLVVEGANTRKRRGGEVRRLTKAVNLIDVATRFLIEFCHCEEQAVFLRGHENSLRSIVCVALVFRSLVADFMEATLDDRQCNDSFIFGNLSPDDVTCGISKLSSFLPGYSVMKRVLDTKVLRMNDHEYAKLNLKSIDKTTVFSRREIQSGEDESHVGSEIVPSHADGVFLL